MAVVVSAPVVDATVCPDCNNAALPSSGKPQSITAPANHDETQLTSGAAAFDSQSPGVTQDLCPFCSHSAAAMASLVCGVPSIISQTSPLPKLFSLSNLSKSISKPPQN